MANPVLRVKDLEVSIQNNIILKDISFEVERGNTVAVIGPNGAGKSTLFRALLNVLPYQGSIEWTDDLSKSYIPQTISVSEIPITVEEFLSMKGVENMDRALRNVELELETVKRKLLSVLSGGELQRVLICTILPYFFLMNPLQEWILETRRLSTRCLISSKKRKESP